MKLLNLLSILSVGCAASLLASCENQDVEFPDYEGGSSVYFAYQYPVRTIVLGEDTYDTTLDNEHKCKIYAVMGGVYANKKRVDIDVAVDNALCSNLYFDNDAPVQAMPGAYYSLAENKISLNHEMNGGVEVQLTDAFFADKNSLKRAYVIPLRMTKVNQADSILSGKPKVQNPVKTNAADWDILPLDYVLYCVKFINPWHANYLRRGVDQITEKGTTTKIIRHKQYVEKDEVCSLVTASLNAAVFPVSTTVPAVGEDGKPTIKTLTCDLLLTFGKNNECVITSGTDEYVASGTGKFVKRGDKKSWGDKDRDVMYLDYQVDFNGKKQATKDTLVVRDRGIKMETFTPSYKVN